MKMPNPQRLVGALLLATLIATPVRAEDNIAWYHRATQGTVTLTANPLGDRADLSRLQRHYPHCPRSRGGDPAMAGNGIR